MAARKSIIFVLVLLLTLCGCTRTVTKIEYIEKPVYVEVPVIQKVEFKPIKKPVIYLKIITKNSTPKEIAEAYVNTVKQQKAYIKQLEDLVQPFYIKDK